MPNVPHRENSLLLTSSHPTDPCLVFAGRKYDNKDVISEREAKKATLCSTKANNKPGRGCDGACCSLGAG